MSGRIVGEVLRYAPQDLTPRERFVLVALAESVIEVSKDRVSRTNTAAIAHQTGYTPGSVRVAIVELTRRALIYPVGRAHRGRAQDYRISELRAHHAAIGSVNGDSRISDRKRQSSLTQSLVDNPPAKPAKPRESVNEDALMRERGLTPTGTTHRNYISPKNSSKCITVERETGDAAPADIVARVAAIRARHRQPASTPVPDEAPALAPLGCAAGLRSAPSGHETRAGP